MKLFVGVERLREQVPAAPVDSVAGEFDGYAICGYGCAQLHDPSVGGCHLHHVVIQNRAMTSFEHAVPHDQWIELKGENVSCFLLVYVGLFGKNNWPTHKASNPFLHSFRTFGSNFFVSLIGFVVNWTHLVCTFSKVRYLFLQIIIFLICL